LAGLSAAGVPAETVSRISEGLQDAASRLAAAGYPELPETVNALTGVSYADAFTSGMATMFLMVSVTMFLTALAMLVGMRRGLRASLVPQSSAIEQSSSVRQRER
jgi:hypothetical protein